MKIAQTKSTSFFVNCTFFAFKDHWPWFFLFLLPYGLCLEVGVLEVGIESWSAVWVFRDACIGAPTVCLKQGRNMLNWVFEIVLETESERD
jgi:hypothetical protein